MKFGSVFTGIGGFELGLENAGWDCAFQIENDKFCNKVLTKHWPFVPRMGDIKAVDERLLPYVDLLAGGFPCQDLSIAGKRAGLSGERSSLFFEFLRLAKELHPQWLLIENVPGLLSSREGEDFHVLLQALAECGYGVAWRTVDSRYFGVAQRRRRVFIVGHLGGPVPYEVLFEPEGGSGNPASRDKAGQDVAGTLGLGTPGARGFRTTDLDGHGAYIPEFVQQAISSKWKKGYSGPAGDEHHNLVAPYRKVHRAASTEDFETWEAADAANTLNLFDEGDVRTTHAVVEPKVIRVVGDYGDPTVKVDDLPMLAANPMSDRQMSVWTDAMVRRLTPTECERLQGFPDGWTCLCGVKPYSGMTCTCPDGPRYSTLGNAVTTKVVEWIGRRLFATAQASVRLAA